ncbi:uncharacterized protein LOC144708047 [Wolffia australiana]
MEMGDIFASTLELEEEQKEEGFRQGFEDGLMAGREDAEILGSRHGFAAGEELGFYSGCVEVWKAAMALDPGLFTARSQRSFSKIAEMVHEYPLMEVEDESAQEKMEAIRLKFRAAAAGIGVRFEQIGSGAGSRSTEF